MLKGYSKFNIYENHNEPSDDAYIIYWLKSGEMYTGVYNSGNVTTDLGYINFTYISRWTYMYEFNLDKINIKSETT